MIAALFSVCVLAGPARAQLAASTDEPAAQTVTFSGMPATFEVPPGWLVLQQERDTALLVPDTPEPQLLVAAHSRLYSSVNEFYELAEQTIHDTLQAQALRVVEGPRSYSVNGQTASVATLAAENPQGEPVRIGLHVVIGEGGVGLGVLTLASVPTFAEGTAVAESILESASFGAFVSDGAAASNLAGRWVRAAASNSGNRSGSTGGWSSGANVAYTFYDDGTYLYTYESFAAVDVPGGGALGTSADEESGRYVVGGDTITLVNDEGSETLEYRVVDERFIQIGDWYFERR